MSLVSPFLAPVNPAGLPIGLCPSAPVGNENITNLTPSDVAELYWTLEKLAIAYDYTVDGSNYSTSFWLNSDHEPIRRNGYAPSFSRSGLTQNTSGLMGVGSNMTVYPLAMSSSFDGTYAMRFTLSESDPLSVLVLNLQALSGYSVLDTATVTLFGNDITVYLNALNSSWTGSINSFSITPTFFTF